MFTAILSHISILHSSNVSNAAHGTYASESCLELVRNQHVRVGAVTQKKVGT